MELCEAYRFCPICGCARQKASQTRPFHCHACQHTSFFGPVAAVGAVITNHLGQVLLLERAKDPGKGKLGMPGGFVDPNESAESALRREIQEEVGISVGRLNYLITAPNAYSYQSVVYSVLDVFYHTHINSDQVINAALSEVAAWMWTDLTTEILERMAFVSNRLALEHFMTL